MKKRRIKSVIGCFQIKSKNAYFLNMPNAYPTLKGKLLMLES